MHHAPDIALFTIAFATGIGLLAQLLAHRWHLPPIVLLLFFGVAVGPSVLGWVEPASLGDGLAIIVKLAVAIILFDGALNLRITDLRKSATEVRRLVTTGVVITWGGALLTARFVAGLSWPVAIVFGALVTVTGPTVVQPLLKRVQLPRTLRTTLEGEAILTDPIGAILAVAVLDILLGLAGVRPIGVLSGVWAYFGRLLVGLAVGWLGGFLLSRLLKQRHWVPGELSSLVTLAGVWTTFAAAEMIQGEAGILAAVVMGLAVQRGAVPEERRLRRFKEQLTVLGLSLLFILLAANLPLEVLRAEGWRGPLAVAVLMFVVRPLSVGLSLARSPLPWRQKVFIMWIGPRGIVAASVASLFAIRLVEAGYPEGQRLLALTFLTIAITVTVQGLSAALASRLLGLESVAGRRAIVVGAGALGRAIASMLREGGRPVLLLDSNPHLVQQAQQLGFDAIHGSALDEALLERIGADEAETLIATTANSEVNVLATQLARDSFGIARAYRVLDDAAENAKQQGDAPDAGFTAFAQPIDVREWDHALAGENARLETLQLPDDWRARPMSAVAPSTGLVVLGRRRNGSTEIAHRDQLWERGDQVIVLTRGSAEDSLASLLQPPPARTG